MKLFGDDAIATLLNKIKAKFNSLAKVATSGSYNDLSDKPTIPSVGNGKITIKQGGIKKGTFTVNQSGATAIELDDNDTHYTSKNVVGSSADDTNNTTTALTNGNVFLNSVENGSVTSSHNIKGIGGTTVSTDKSGNIIIKAPTSSSGTYSAGTGLSLSGTTFNHSNSVTAGTAQGDASKTLTFGGTFTVPTVTYDAQGHVTGKGTTTMTMPANPNTDTKNTAGSTDTSSKIFLIGATSQAANPQTYSHDTAYVGTDGCLYSGGTKVSVDGHTHSDYVKKSGSEVSSLNAITAETSTTSVIIPNETAIASSPFARDFWHDHFAFLRGGTSIINNQVSTDGTTWTDDDSDLTPLFIQKETHGITILSTSQLAHRFTIYGDNIKYSYITWFEIGVSYTNPFSSFEVHIESSSDNSSWSTAHKSIVSGNSVPVFLKQNRHMSSDGYLRFTFTKTTNTTTGSVNISCLKAFTSRKGNQGLGIDYEYPYDWNSNMDIYPVTDNKSTLGTSGRKWANVYATKFTGALAGNAGTATKWATARNINGMLVQGDANRTNYGTCSTAAATVAKTVDCTGFELVTGAEITVKFTVDNAAANPTLNVNGTRARPIYYRGSPIATGYLAAGRVYTFRYDGARYELVGDVNTDSDTKVTQAVTTANAEYPLLLGPNGQTTNATTTAYFDSGVTLNPSTNTITANISGSAGTASKWATARNINGMLVQGDANRVNYGVCSTAATTAAKTVDCAGFTLITGAEITVKFTNTNSAAQPTLNVNNQGAKAIYYRGNYIPPTCLAKDRVYTFRYDGKNYELVGDINTDTNTDTKVTQAVTTANAEYPLLLGPNGQTTNATTTAYFDSGVTLNPSTNTITANISGNAGTATSVANALTVKANGTQLYTYNGSAAKTINIKAGSNITITSDSSGNITISSTASAGSVTGDVGTVVYEATAYNTSLRCDGSTTNNTNNSVTIQDGNWSYKRFRFYCKGYFGLVCTDMPLDRQCDSYITGDERGKRYGGVIFPTAENGNINNTGIGPSNHMYYEIKWRVEKVAVGWTVRVVDSGWLGFNAGITSNADYTKNAGTSNAGTGYISWNQRHNYSYGIYKIVAYTD